MTILWNQMNENTTYIFIYSKIFENNFWKYMQSFYSSDLIIIIMIIIITIIIKVVYIGK